MNTLDLLMSSPVDLEGVTVKSHAIWITSMQSKGRASFKGESGEELMVPFSQLSLAEQELIRVKVKAVWTAIELLRLVSLREAVESGEYGRRGRRIPAQRSDGTWVEEGVPVGGCPAGEGGGY
jgi:hypothetical protein